MDHSGNLPAIYAKGFKGPIYATEATCNLCDIMLRDSAHIQMFEAEWRNRKAKRQGKPEFVPAYTMEDAMGVIRNFVGCPYDKGIILGEGLRVKFIDAGHLLGSSSIEVNIQEDGVEKTIVFSRRHWKIKSAFDKRSGLFQKSGLCGDGVHIWGQKPRRAA